MILSLLLIIVSYAAQWVIFKKMGRQGWEGIVPFYNYYVIFYELYGNGWRFLFILIPIYGIYVWIKMWIDLAHAFHMGTGFGVGMFLLPFIFCLILAFGSAQYADGSMANETEDIITNVIDKTKDVASGIKSSAGAVATNSNGVWVCKSCGSENSKKSKFCVICGEKKPDPKTCPYCGQLLAEHMLFCPSCGKKYDLDEYQKHLEEEAKSQGKKICRHCGAMMPIDGTFCGKCGKSQDVDSLDDGAETDNKEA